PGGAGFAALTFGWRWVFLGLLPLIVVSGAIALRGLRGIRRHPGHGAAPAVSPWRRVVEAAVLAVGVVLLTAGLSNPSLGLLAGLTAAGVLVTAFALRRLTPPGTLRARRGYPSAVLLRGVLTF